MDEIVEIKRGSEPLLVSIPHTGTVIPADVEHDLVSPWLARKDTDWWIERLYGFAAGMGATVVRATHSRTVIDVNRDPSGVSLYPGQTTTGLCPTETFDGELLYRNGREPDTAEIARRRKLYFDPYHAALEDEILRLEQSHQRIVLYDCHSIRSVIPRLFEGELPHMNLGTNLGASCDRGFCHVVQAVCDASGFSWVVNHRFTGGWITRHYGRPDIGVHAIQMELACRSYLDEPAAAVDEASWPPPYDAARAAKMRETLKSVFKVCLSYATRGEVTRVGGAL
jgi:N-formylglutamate deformylase